MKYIVKGNFKISQNEFKTLEGCPERVGENVLCNYNPFLVSLKGCPRVIGENFYCFSNPLLKSLYHGYSEKVKVGGNFECGIGFSEEEIRSYFDIDGVVSFRYWSSHDDSVTSPSIIFDYSGLSVSGNFNLYDNNGLMSLEGCPERVGGDFSCVSNNLVSLKGCPRVVDGNFFCYGNEFLKSLDHGWGEKVKVGGKIHCDNTFSEEDVRKYFDVVGHIDLG